MSDEIRIIHVGVPEKESKYIDDDDDVAAASRKSVEDVEADFKTLKCIMLDDDPYKETMKNA